MQKPDTTAATEDEALIAAQAIWARRNNPMQFRDLAPIFQRGLIEDARAAITATNPASDDAATWRDIRTAEKNGTPRDLWVVDRENGQGERVPSGYWGTDSLPFEWDASDGWIDPRGGVDGASALIDVSNYDVTHWMPVPEGPSA